MTLSRVAQRTLSPASRGPLVDFLASNLYGDPSVSPFAALRIPSGSPSETPSGIPSGTVVTLQEPRRGPLRGSSPPFGCPFGGPFGGPSGAHRGGVWNPFGDPFGDPLATLAAGTPAGNLGAPTGTHAESPQSVENSPVGDVESSCDFVVACPHIQRRCCLLTQHNLPPPSPDTRYWRRTWPLKKGEICDAITGRFSESEQLYSF